MQDLLVKIVGLSGITVGIVIWLAPLVLKPHLQSKNKRYPGAFSILFCNDLSYTDLGCKIRNAIRFVFILSGIICFSSIVAFKLIII